jgi:hypothetical protein
LGLWSSQSNDLLCLFPTSQFWSKLTTNFSPGLFSRSFQLYSWKLSVWLLLFTCDPLLPRSCDSFWNLSFNQTLSHASPGPNYPITMDIVTVSDPGKKRNNFFAFLLYCNPR